MSRKKVWVVIPTLGGGGAEQMVIQLCHGIDRAKFDINLISLYNKGYAVLPRLEYIEHAGIDVQYMNKKEGFDLRLLMALIRKIWKEKPDIIHTHLAAFLYIAVPRLFMRFIHIHTMHSIAGREQGIYKRLMVHMCRNCKTKFVLLNQDTLLSMKENYPILDKNAVCIANGVDLEKFSFKARDYEKKSLNLIAVGSLIPVKNHEMLLRAFKKYISERDADDTLTILGEGVLRSELEQQVFNMGLTQIVNLPGNTSNVKEYLYNADVFVMTSLYEGVPLAMLEAAATGLPIVSTNVGGINSVVREDAFLFSSGDEERLADILCMLANDSNVRKEYAERSAKIAKRHSLEMMIQAYETLYDHAAEQRT